MLKHRKNKKRGVLELGLCLSLLSSNLAFADVPVTTYTPSSTNSVSYGGVDVETVGIGMATASSFSITLPKEISMNGSNGTGNYTVTVSGDIDNQEYVMVVPDSTFSMFNTSGKPSITATITSPDGNQWDSDDCAANSGDGTTKNFSISAPTSAGIWNGTFNFNISFMTREVLGVMADFENNTYTRLKEAVGKSLGTDFDSYDMYGGRRRCNVADDGTILCYYGDAGYTEDGNNGQVMVYQPKFYYMVAPINITAQESGLGYHLKKAAYYVSDEEYAGFKIHPAFIGPSGEELDYILIGAYEGSIYDVSASAYLVNDEQAADFTTSTGDKFSSIAGVRPASGLSQNLTRPNVEVLCQNRGSKWHEETVQVASMEQLLMMIEMSNTNSQSIIGDGVVGITDNSSYNCASYTGSTSSLGNTTGRAGSTNDYSGATQTATNKTSVSYRGVENDWGSIWKFQYGVNIWGDGTKNGGVPYICSNYSFAESKNTDNYVSAGFTVSNSGGYLKAVGYSETYDWLFIASQVGGGLSDYQYFTSNLNGYRIAVLGGCWGNGSIAGAFSWILSYGVGYRYRDIGARLICLP